MSPLHKACYHGHVEVAKMLLDHRCEPDARDLHGNTPVQMCALGGQVECLVLLLEAGATLMDRYAITKWPFYLSFGSFLCTCLLCFELLLEHDGAF